MTDGASRKSYHGKRCPYCNRTMDEGSFHLRPTRDHITPKSKGGRAKVICCNKCNGIKGDMMPELWAAYMHANPGWWLLTKAERRARNTEQLKGRKLVLGPQRQGSPKPSPVVVPPELVWPLPHHKSMTAKENAARIKKYEEAQLIQQTINWDERLRAIPWPPSKLGDA